MVISNFELELINRLSVGHFSEIKIRGLLINDGKIVGRLSEVEDDVRNKRKSNYHTGLH